MSPKRVFVNKDGERARLPIDNYLTGGEGEQHWLDKGMVRLEDWIDQFPESDIRSVLPDNSWSGRRCFIVGGGPSLKGFDWSQLDGELTIAVNRSFEYFDPTILFSADNRFWRYMWNGELGEQSTSLFEKFIGIKVGASTTLMFPESVKTVNVSGEFGRTFKDGIKIGGNSGYAALNLAVCLGANPIYLLGFDMHTTHRQEWFHDGYPDNNDPVSYRSFQKTLQKIAPKLADWGIQVINLNPDSALKCFDFGTMPGKTTVPIVVAHYTKEYAAELENLRESCEKFGLEYEFTEIESTGSWRTNSNYCCIHIMDMLNKHNRPVLRVDADAIFRAYPEIFEQGFDADFAAHIRDGKELLGGTLYFNNTVKAREILAKWIDACEAKPRTSNQVLLHDIVRNKRQGAKFIDLPAAYTKIFDTMPGDAVIEHMQASRRLKKTIR